jgi:hypothetical protein
MSSVMSDSKLVMLLPRRFREAMLCLPVWCLRTA